MFEIELTHLLFVYQLVSNKTANYNLQCSEFLSNDIYFTTYISDVSFLKLSKLV